MENRLVRRSKMRSTTYTYDEEALSSLKLSDRYDNISLSSLRLNNILRRNSITTVGDIIGYRASNFSMLKGAGQSTCNEFISVRNKLIESIKKNKENSVDDNVDLQKELWIDIYTIAYNNSVESLRAEDHSSIAKDAANASVKAFYEQFNGDK
jgi:hypothetical protein